MPNKLCLFSPCPFIDDQVFAVLGWAGQSLAVVIRLFIPQVGVFRHGR